MVLKGVCSGGTTNGQPRDIAPTWLSLLRIRCGLQSSLWLCFEFFPSFLRTCHVSSSCHPWVHLRFLQLANRICGGWLLKTRILTVSVLSQSIPPAWSWVPLISCLSVFPSFLRDRPQQHMVLATPWYSSPLFMIFVLQSDELTHVLFGNKEPRNNCLTAMPLWDEMQRSGVLGLVTDAVQERYWRGSEVLLRRGVVDLLGRVKDRLGSFFRSIFPVFDTTKSEFKSPINSRINSSPLTK